MKIYFIRHGETESNKKGTVTGHIDSPLSEGGIEQTKKTLSEIPNDFQELYSSDLIRCKQTAEILNQKLNLQIKFDVRFYLLAILFIIFDLEIAFLFPWSVILHDITFFGFFAMIIFLLELIVGYVFIWKKGALEWE